jgi:hypothetical protein
MAHILSQVGWRVGVLAGGYRTYRREVTTRLYDSHPGFRAVVLDGPTGSGKTEVLRRLPALGVQVLDLEGLAEHRGSLLGALPGDKQAKVEPAALVDRVITLEVGPLLEKPRHTDLFHAVFLIGLRDQEQIAAGLKTGASKMRDRDTPRRELVLHVARTATPDVAVVVKVSAKRRVRPILSIGRHHIRVAHQCQRWTIARARQASDQIRAFGITRHELNLQPIGLEILLDDHRDRRLAPRRVRRVDAHKIAQQLDRFVSEC